MTSCSPDLAGAAAVEETYRVCNGLYLLGSLERALTVYSQQVRAHNLIWALWELHQAAQRPIGKVAIVGGGIAGLTAAACILSRFDPATPVTLFEQSWDLCPLQQGSDTRWLHPRIYNWPYDGSRAPSASLPVLNWSEGRASDVARTVVTEFGEYCKAFRGNGSEPSIVIGLSDLQIKAETLEIDWTGTRADRAGIYFQRGGPERNRMHFDTIVLAAGFGSELTIKEYPTAPYWRNEQIAQPTLDGGQTRYVVSGFGDGALVDLCRLTIERFRQDTIVYELFGSNPEKTEAELAEKLDVFGPSKNLYEFLLDIESDLLSAPRQQLSRRLRKDTAVALHLSGKDGKVNSFSTIFGATSSFLNRLLTLLLYRCDAFSVSFLDLDTCVSDHRATAGHVLCRYGVNALNHIRAIIVDYAELESRLNEMRDHPKQLARRLWKQGTFPIPNRRSPQ